MTLKLKKVLNAYNTTARAPVTHVDFISTEWKQSDSFIWTVFADVILQTIQIHWFLYKPCCVRSHTANTYV